MSINIYFNTQYRKFHARIYDKGTFTHVGRFDTREEAEIKAKEFANRYIPVDQFDRPDNRFEEVHQFISSNPGFGNI